MKYKKALIFIVGVTMLLLACGIPGLEDGYLNFDFEIDEAQFEQLMQDGNFTVNGENVFDLITAVDFRDGVIPIEGTRDGVDGYVDVALSSVDNQLNVEIVDHDVQGMDANLDEANQALTDALAGATDQSGDIEFTNVEVTDDAIVMELRVRVSQ